MRLAPTPPTRETLEGFEDQATAGLLGPVAVRIRPSRSPAAGWTWLWWSWQGTAYGLFISARKRWLAVASGGVQMCCRFLFLLQFYRCSVCARPGFSCPRRGPSLASRRSEETAAAAAAGKCRIRWRPRKFDTEHLAAKKPGWAARLKAGKVAQRWL